MMVLFCIRRFTPTLLPAQPAADLIRARADGKVLNPQDPRNIDHRTGHQTADTGDLQAAALCVPYLRPKLNSIYVPSFRPMR